MKRTALKLATATVLAASLAGVAGAPAFASGGRHHHEPSGNVTGGNGGAADNYCLNVGLQLLSGLGILGKGTAENAECTAAAPGGSASDSD